MNRPAIIDRFTNYLMMNSEQSIETLTYNFINILNTYIEIELRNYHRAILYLHKNIISIFILSILCYKNSEELIYNINKLLDFVMNLYEIYKI